jgi:energy-coupling factor transport system ATP-binding protein
LVFQYPENQLFATSVFDDVAFGPRNLGFDSSEVEIRVREALEQVGLDANDLGKKSPFELSGGQQRRVAFAGVLAMKPTTFVLDEPTAGLDPLGRSAFLDLIDRLNTQGITIVLVSHSMSILARMSDRILVLNEGKQFLCAPAKEVFSHSGQLRDIGLGLPASQRIIDTLKDKGLTIQDGLFETDQLANAIAKLYRESKAI